MKEVNYALPLWIFSTRGDLLNTGRVERFPNLASDFLSALSKNLGGLNPSPEHAFAYIYAILYAPNYRARYDEFLRRDFPRIPLTSNPKIFKKLVALGQEMIDLHLLHSPLPAITSFPKAGSNHVHKIEFRADPKNSERGRVQINAEQYFEGVPRRVWEYTIGGYQVAHKWLKDRKGRFLTFDELQHYGHVVATLNATIRLQADIDAAITDWPLI
jgi:predicted helicase